MDSLGRVLTEAKENEKQVNLFTLWVIFTAAANLFDKKRVGNSKLFANSTVQVVSLFFTGIPITV